MEPEVVQGRFIRWMIRRDMPDVLQIEHESFVYPWDEEDFLQALRQRNCIGMVLVNDEKILGYVLYELYKSKLTIINFAVHPFYRRLGFGGEIVTKLQSKLASHRRRLITTHLRESNLTAHLFFKSQGFRCTNVVRNYYNDTNEDAYHMVYRLKIVKENQ